MSEKVVSVSCYLFRKNKREERVKEKAGNKPVEKTKTNNLISPWNYTRNCCVYT